MDSNRTRAAAGGIDVKTSQALVAPNVPRVGSVELAPPAVDTTAIIALSAVGVGADHVPALSQSGVVLLLNLLLNMTFFIIVPTSAAYADALGASTWFSGLTIGISTLIAGLVLVPFSQRYPHTYRTPMLFSAVCITVGEVVYALAGVADTAWLMFTGRVILGAGFVSWMYVKRYMTDANVVGAQRRTMMSACLVMTQVAGMAVGPYIGGVLAKQIRPMSEENRLWNGFTASGWLMAGVFAAFFALAWFVFRDPVPVSPVGAVDTAAQVELQPLPVDAVDEAQSRGSKRGGVGEEATLRRMVRELSAAQKFSVVTMCWFSMVNFLVLGAWEANIPVFGSLRFGWDEYDAGNVIALGGLATMPILFALVFAARHIQDRLILATGLLLGLLGLSLHLGSLGSAARSAVARLGGLGSVSFGRFFTSWFLVALGYNMLTTVTLSMVSKQVPARYNGLCSTLIQLSNYSGRIAGALWGSTIYQVGQFSIVALELAVTLLGTLLVGLMWRNMHVERG